MAQVPFAPQMYRRLNGIFCIYKPSGVHMRRVQFNLRHKLAEEMNAMPGRVQRKIVKITEDRSNANLPVITSVPDPADHELVLGPRYLLEDFHLRSAHPLSEFSCGINLIGIGPAAPYLKFIRDSRYLKVYHVTGQLGRATTDYTPDSRLAVKTTWRHVTHEQLDRQLAAIQATHQRSMYRYAGVDLESQTAYDLAVDGLIRPQESSPPIVYNIKCIEFQPPRFVLEIHAVNETCDFLKQLIDLIGRDLKSSAVCRKIHRIRVGHFGLEHALLQKHWKVQHIIENIVLCRLLVDRETMLHPGPKFQPRQRTEKVSLEDNLD